MNEVLSQLQQILVSALAAAIVAMLGVGWKYVQGLLNAKIDQIKNKTNNDLLASILDRVKEVSDDVSISFDPVAEKMKEAAADGKLTPEEIADIQKNSRDVVDGIIRELYPQSVLDKAGVTDDALSELIARGIEASVQKRILQKNVK